MSALAIVVSSSDPTRDVFERVFAHFGSVWPQCPYSRYVGLSSEIADRHLFGFEVLPARRRDGWRPELAAQIRALPPEIDFVLLLLDDFLLLGPVSQRSVEQALRLAVDGRWAYLRLKPVERSIWVTGLRKLAAWLGGKPAVRLQRSEPYYSSLQAAIWRRDHLLRCLEQPGSIWEFEHFVPPGADHYALTSGALPYRHVVEKGVWRAYAPQLFARLGVPFEPGRRPIRPSGDLLRFRWEQCKFGMLGYVGPKLKRIALLLLGKRTAGQAHNRV